ncbi:DUF3558 domain-containing protein [Nocardia takedensis]|uniref:DUF3558 domain-containing protein n=1 Tax=Nocardia takedensis TaxID=259390 RepID=UPI003F766FAF
MVKDSTGWTHTIWAVAMCFAVAAGLSGCEKSGTATPAPAPAVLGPDTSAPPNPPWTLPQLVYHPCTVLRVEDLARFGFAVPGQPSVPPHGSYCQWRSPDSGPGQVRMFFAPDPWHRYRDLEQLHRSAANYRTLTLAAQPAFLLDEHSENGQRNCRIWAAVASGGAFEFEYAATAAEPDDFCDEATAIATVIAGRIN